jgi:hypothetical protein
MTIEYPPEPEITDPNATEESPNPDDDNDDEHGIAETDGGDSSGG